MAAGSAAIECRDDIGHRLIRRDDPVINAARIEQGAVIGQDASVGPYCIVGPDVVIGDGCRLVAHVHVAGHTSIAIGELLKAAGIPAQISGEPPLFDVVFTDEPVRDYRGTLRGDTDKMRHFNALLRERGILKGESKYYISLAHTPEDIQFTIAAWEDAIKALKAG